MDKEMFDLIEKENKRQQNNIELIASENYVSEAILNATGSILTNKYAEGYSGKRYYGGCEHIDEIESLAIERAKELFKCSFANVQPHSGSTANMAAYRALLKPGAKVLGMRLDHGGHLTHGLSVNFSGTDYNFISYELDNETEMLDYDKIREIALKEKPEMIVAGASAYSRIIDFEKLRSIADEIGAYLMVDIAHIAGLVATGYHPSPFPCAHIVTSTTHKTLRGPRGGLILSNDKEIAQKIDKVIFPGLQGGPLEHVIAAKGICFYEALQPNFKTYIKQVIDNAKALSDTLIENNVKVISGGTDNHIVLIDVKKAFNITGKVAEGILDEIRITTNKNAIPNDEESRTETSGLRLGTAAMTTRGLKEKDFKLIGEIIVSSLSNIDNGETLIKNKDLVSEIIKEYPL